MSLNVYYSADPDKPVFVGKLAWHEHHAYFEYAQAFLDTGLNLSPFMPFKTELLKADREPWRGLHGLFNDSLPDGWGMLLMDRYFLSKKINPSTVSPVDRLAYLGNRTMGALTYQPSTGPDEEPVHVYLQKMSESAMEIYEGHYSDVLPEMIRVGGSPGGARPKALVHLSGDEMITGDIDVPEEYEPWIIKFHTKEDGVDAGRQEYEYSLMAKQVGIDMPETRLFSTPDGNEYFGVKRFDRIDRKRVHMHTLGGMINADFRVPSIDYLDFLKVTFMLSKDIRQVESAFKLMVFNVLIGNKDDHSKNFSFLMDENGQWSLSPAYDLTKSKGVAGHHTTAVNGNYTAPTNEDMIQVGLDAGLKEKTCKAAIEEIRSVQAV